MEEPPPRPRSPAPRAGPDSSAGEPSPPRPVALSLSPWSASPGLVASAPHLCAKLVITPTCAPGYLAKALSVSWVSPPPPPKTVRSLERGSPLPRGCRRVSCSPLGADRAVWRLDTGQTAERARLHTALGREMTACSWREGSSLLIQRPSPRENEHTFRQKAAALGVLLRDPPSPSSLSGSQGRWTKKGLWRNGGGYFTE